MKNDNALKIFIKGFVVGLGIIFPGSASALAIVMGIYERILNVVNNFRKALKEDTKFVIFFVLGVIVSCVVGCLALDYTLEKYPVATLLLFIGLIIGGIPSIIKNTTKKDWKIKNILFSFLGIFIIGAIVTCNLLLGSGNVTLETNFTGLLKLFLCGLFGGGSMMVPGMSGSVMVMILGYYEPILNAVKEICHFVNVGQNILIGGVFALGMLLGVIIISKLMSIGLKKHKTKTYFLIIGLVIASTLDIIVDDLIISCFPFNIIELIVGIILFAIGFILSFKYLKEE